MRTLSKATKEGAAVRARQFWYVYFTASMGRSGSPTTQA